MANSLRSPRGSQGGLSKSRLCLLSLLEGRLSVFGTMVKKSLERFLRSPASGASNNSLVYFSSIPS